MLHTFRPPQKHIWEEDVDGVAVPVTNGAEEVVDGVTVEVEVDLAGLAGLADLVGTCLEAQHSAHTRIDPSSLLTQWTADMAMAPSAATQMAVE
jgi:hypothetical protein